MPPDRNSLLLSPVPFHPPFVSNTLKHLTVIHGLAFGLVFMLLARIRTYTEPHSLHVMLSRLNVGGGSCHSPLLQGDLNGILYMALGWTIRTLATCALGNVPKTVAAYDVTAG